MVNIKILYIMNKLGISMEDTLSFDDETIDWIVDNLVRQAREENSIIT